MQIFQKSLPEIHPYGNNPRKNDNAVEAVAESIRQFGFKVPIVIDKNNVIVCGHTRLKAAERLHMDSVPFVVADDLTDEQVKAFRLADNKVSELASWDANLLSFELDDLPEIDMEAFGFEYPDLGNIDGGYYGDERERTNKAYNLDLAHETDMTDDFWQMPVIKKCDHIPDDLIGFNYAKTSKEKTAGIHFYIDDYQFERVWNYPEKYTEILSEYDCILTPDFSLYMDMPMPMKIWNVYRSRQIGAYYQSLGLTVIPTLSWAEPETFCFCFQGIEKGSVVSVSTIGVKEHSESMEIWKAGMEEAIKQIEPSAILEYGGNIGFDYGIIPAKRFINRVTKNWSK